MPAPTLMIPRFLTMRGSQNGLAGYLQKLLGSKGSMGVATVLNSATTVVVTDANAATGDLILSGVYTKGTNACYVVGCSITNGTSFTLTVNTDPGSGGAVLWFVRIPTALLFTT